MKKQDVKFALSAGFLSGFLLLAVIENLKEEVRAVFHLNILLIGFIVVVFTPLLFIAFLWVVSLLRLKFYSIFQFAKFLIVGILNTLIDLGVLNFFIFLSGINQGIFFAIFKTISFSSAAINSYFWNKAWTFEKKFALNKKEFFRFYLVTSIGFFLNVGGAVFVNSLYPAHSFSRDAWANIAALSGIFLGMMWNFLNYKFFIFKK